MSECLCVFTFYKSLVSTGRERIVSILVGSPRWMSPLLSLLSIFLMCTHPFQTVDRLQKGGYSRDKFSRRLSNLCQWNIMYI